MKALYNECVQKRTVIKSEFYSPNGIANDWWLSRLTPLIDSTAGRVTKILGSSLKIDERKKAEEKIGFQSNLLDCIKQAVIATDLKGQILYFNKFAEQHYQWPAKDTLKMNIMDVTVPQTSKEQAKEIMLELSKSESWSGDLKVQKKGGSTFMAHVIDSPIIDDDGKLIAQMLTKSVIFHFFNTIYPP